MNENRWDALILKLRDPELIGHYDVIAELLEMLLQEIKRVDSSKRELRPFEHV